MKLMKPRQITIKGFQGSASKAFGIIETIKWKIQDNEGKSHNLII